MPVIWNMPAQWLRNKRDIIRTGQRVCRGYGDSKFEPPPPPWIRKPFLSFFFCLSERLVMSDQNDGYPYSVYTWKIDPKFGGQKKSVGVPPPPPKKPAYATGWGHEACRDWWSKKLSHTHIGWSNQVSYPVQNIQRLLNKRTRSHLPQQLHEFIFESN